MRKLARVLSLLVASITLLAVSSVNAQSNGLGVSPRKDFTVQSGKTVADTLYISNLSLNQDLQVNIRLVDFGAANETGTPALQLADNAPQTPWSLKPFVKVQSSVRIAAGKSAYVPITVTIPGNQGAGSYYSAVEYTAQNPETKEKVNISASTASLVFVTVPGEAKEKLRLKQFGAFESDGKGEGSFKSLFLGATPKEFGYRLQNEGNIAEQPSGSLVVKNMFGRTVKEVEDANPKKQLVLIGQTRRFQVCIKSSVLTSKAPSGQETQQQTTCDDPGLLPGRYTAQVALYYGLNGSNSQEILSSTSFWYLPLWSIIALVVLLLLIAGLVWLIYRAFSGKRRRYRR
ncbi:MAG: hypothetical protein ABWX94_02165 [Candidatus Saccharimonadales bacterium]